MTRQMTHIPIKRYTSLASFCTKEHERCTVPGCARRPAHWGAALCTKHTARAQRHGHVSSTAIKARELAAFSDYVDHGLKLFDGTPAVTTALRRAHQLLNFTATTSEPWQAHLEGRTAAIRQKAGHVVDARQLLLVLLSYFAFEAAHPERVPNVTVRDIGLARAVARLGRCKQPEPRKPDVIASGAYIAEQFGLFATMFLHELQKLTRAEARRKEREMKALADFGDPNAHPNFTPEDHPRNPL